MSPSVNIVNYLKGLGPVCSHGTSSAVFAPQTVVWLKID